MARIGASLSGIERVLLNRWADAQAAIAISNLRLATEKDVNTPRDNPTAFVTLARYQSQLTAVTDTMAQVTAAGTMISQTQTSMGQIRSQLDTIRTELEKDENQALTADERAESQAKIDQAITKINEFSTTTINGRRLLDGSADYQISGQNRSQVAKLTVHSLFPGSTQTISGRVIEPGRQAQLVYTGTADDEVAATAEFTLTGSAGSVSLTVTGGESLSDAAQRANDNSHKTGITATVVDNQLILRSVDYGSDATASIEVASGTFNVTGTGTGADAAVEINGLLCDDGQVHGNRVTLSQTGLQCEVEFTPTFVGQFDPVTVSGGGLTFSLQTDSRFQSTLAIPSLQAVQLGGLSGTLDQIASGGPYSGLGHNTSQALRIVDEALGQMDRVEGSVDGFYNSAITSSSALLSDLEDDLQTAIQQTDGFNEEEENTLIAENEGLASNALSGLTILNQQRSAVIDMIKHIAGLS
jgi:flagellin-like hook-associated protein FlgL